MAPYRSPVARLAVQLAVAAGGYVVTAQLGGDGEGWRYGAAAFGFLCARILVVALNRPRIGAPVPYAVVVPTFNEDPDTLRRCLQSLLMQWHRPEAIVVVDDGSQIDPAPAVRAVASLAAARHIPLLRIRHDTNQGKREAILTGRRALSSPVEVLVCVDSDTIIRADACRELTGAFVDRRVQCATGLVTAANRARNLLTWLIDVRYTGAFEFDRASQSAMGGAMVCACGSLAAYRTQLVDQWAEDFTGQTFGGVRCTFGDDRRLTSYALRGGRAVYVRQARAWTEVPERLGQFTRQQVRWSRSWGRESLLAMREQPWLRPGRWIVTVEAVTWAAFTVSLLLAIARHAAHGIDVGHVLVVAAAAVARSGAYAHRDDLRAWERAMGLLLCPLYSLLNVWVLLPLRVYALATMARSEWGTRSASGQPEPAAA